MKILFLNNCIKHRGLLFRFLNFSDYSMFNFDLNSFLYDFFKKDLFSNTEYTLVDFSFYSYKSSILKVRLCKTCLIRNMLI